MTFRLNSHDRTFTPASCMNNSRYKQKVVFYLAAYRYIKAKIYCDCLKV